MSKAKHTPGPWVVEDPFGTDMYSIVQDGLEVHEWQFIAHVPVGIPAEGLMPRQEARANADMMIAAPDMLTALDQSISAFMALAGFGPEIKVLIGEDAWDKIGGAMQASRAALSKATGEQS